jgi:hypothetical protein
MIDGMPPATLAAGWIWTKEGSSGDCSLGVEALISRFDMTAGNDLKNKLMPGKPTPSYSISAGPNH